jgi:hypothetical protein
MKNTKVVINGFSVSVVENLIQLLTHKATECYNTECYNNMAKVLASSEKDGLRTFSLEYALLIQMLGKWMLIDAPKKFESSKELSYFLQSAKDLLDTLTPAE